jgi:hypothetical protein
MIVEPKYKSSLKCPLIPGFEWQVPDDDKDRASFRDTLTHGCTILMIHSDKATSGPPYDFIYTVGFFLNLKHPEFFIKGLLSERTGMMMNDLFSYVEQGHRIKDGDTLRYDFGEGEKKLVARPFPQHRYRDYLGWGCWFHRSLLWKQSPVGEHKFPVLQLFWPDRNGLYPWDAGCDPKTSEIQTPVQEAGYKDRD